MHVCLRLRRALTLLAATGALTALATDPPVFTVPKTASTPTVDGRIWEAEWDDAVAITGLIDQFDGVAAPRQATFWLKYDDTAVYVAQRSRLAPGEGDEYRKTGSAIPQPPRWFEKNDQCVVVCLAPGRKNNGDGPSHYQLRFNCRGELLTQEICSQWRGIKAVYPPNMAWDSRLGREDVRSSFSTDRTTWESECRIPLEGLKVERAPDGEQWGLFLARDYPMAEQTAITTASDWRFGYTPGNRHNAGGLGLYANYGNAAEYVKVRLAPEAPAIRVLDWGNLSGGTVSPRIAVKNTGRTGLRVKLSLAVTAGAGAPGVGQAQALDLSLRPGEDKPVTFQPISLAQVKGTASLAFAAADERGNILYRQEVPCRLGFGTEKLLPAFAFQGPNRSLAGNSGALSVYHPLLNAVVPQIAFPGLPDIASVSKATLSVRRSGAPTPLFSQDWPAFKPQVRLLLDNRTINGAIVLSWTAPQTGSLLVNLEAAYLRPDNIRGGQNSAGMQLLLWDAVTRKLSPLIPRLFLEAKDGWKPLKVRDVQVTKGDRVQFYYNTTGDSPLALRGALVFSSPTQTLEYAPGAVRADMPNPLSRAWEFGYDPDRAPNPDGEYQTFSFRKHERDGGYTWEIRSEKAWITGAMENVEYENRFLLPSLEPGVYEAAVTLYDRTGKPLGRAREPFIRYNHGRDLPWLGTSAGAGNRVLPPWSPLETRRSDGSRLQVVTSGRTTTFDGSGLPVRLMVSGEELLEKPVHLVVTQDFRPADIKAGAAVQDEVSLAHETKFKGSLTGPGWQITTNVRTAYDGYSEYRIRIEPKGRQSVDKIQCLIPLRLAMPTHLHAAAGMGAADGTSALALRPGTGKLWDSGMSNNQSYNGNGLRVGNFKPYVWVGNARQGLAFMADNDRGWVPDDTRQVPAIEVVRDDTAVNVILNLVARSCVLSEPREVLFSLQSTPVKPLPADMRQMRNRLNYPASLVTYDADGWASGGLGLRLGRFDLTGDAIPFAPLDWSRARRRQSELLNGIGLPPGVRLGPVVWTPRQPLAARPALLELDDPGQPGLQGANLAGYLQQLLAASEEGAPACTAMAMSYRLWRYQRWAKEAGLTGLFFSDTEPVLAAAPDAGQGYVLDLPDRPALHGKVQPGYTLTVTREFLRRLRHLIAQDPSRQPLLWVDASDCVMTSAFAFADVVMVGNSGPTVNRQFPWFSEKFLPEPMQVWNSQSATGLPTAMADLFQSNFEPRDAEKTVLRNMEGWRMLHDTDSAGQVTQAWTGLDCARRAEFLPYWDAKVAAALTTGSTEVYASAWRQDNALRLLVFNRASTERRNLTLRLDAKALGLMGAANAPVTVTDLESKPLRAAPEGTMTAVTLDVRSRDWRLLRATLGK